ncbi:uncharacterized protein LOC144290810 [Canis aureus]
MLRTGRVINCSGVAPASSSLPISPGLPPLSGRREEDEQSNSMLCDLQAKLFGGQPLSPKPGHQGWSHLGHVCSEEPLVGAADGCRGVSCVSLGDPLSGGICWKATGPETPRVETSAT